VVLFVVTLSLVTDVSEEHIRSIFRAHSPKKHNQHLRCFPQISECNESSVSLKGMEFLDQLGDYQLLKKDVQ
jgi:hypothetical protein